MSIESTLTTIHPPKRFPFQVYFFCVIGLALMGLADSVYLSISHFRVYTDMGYQSFCAISKAINCDTVSQSPYSIFWGVPVPVWGVLGYALFLWLTLLAGQKKAQRQRLWILLQSIALVFCLYSIALALISTYLIHSYCIMCILSYGVNLGLLFSVWIIRRRFVMLSLFEDAKRDWAYIRQNRTRFFAIFGISILAACGLVLFFPAYWQIVPSHEEISVETGLTDEGHPYYGSPTAAATIEEFSDYQCFQCRKMHYYLRQLIAQYPDRARLVHRHYPMDHHVNPGVKVPFHVGAGKMALLAIYASAKDKFWQMNDILFGMVARKENFSLKTIAEETGIDQRELAWALKDKRVYQRLALDLKKGGELGIEGTPGFLINGEVYQGNIPYDVLKQIFFRAE